MKKILLIISIVIFSTATMATTSHEVGSGYNYGGAIGWTVNTQVSSNVELFTGIGVAAKSAGYVVGTKFWVNDKARLTLNYGTNCHVNSSGWTDYEGLNVGIGYAFSGKEEGWAIDLLLLDISDCAAAASSSDNSAVRLAAGYRF